MPVQLAACSHKSIRYGLLPAAKIPELAKAQGHTSVCLADRFYCAGIPAFLPACEQHEIAPMLGLWLEFPEIQQSDSRSFLIPGDVLIIASTNKALSDLLEISAKTLRDNYTLQQAKRDLVASPEIFVLPATVPALKLLFGQAKGTAWVPMPDESNHPLLAESSKIKIPAVACLPWACAGPEDFSAMSVLHSQNTNRPWEFYHAQYLDKSHFHLQSTEALDNLFPQELIQNAEILAQSCTALPKPLSGKLSRTPNSEISEDFRTLAELCQEGLRKKFKDNPPEAYTTQLEMELTTIENSGFAGIFLAVRDLARYMDENNYILGPGRGSAAGSLASHLLGITVPDPLKEGLWFERFLNPDRISPPDFDLDLPVLHQKTAQDFMQRKWSPERTAPIATWTTYATKSAFRAATRARGIPPKTATEELRRVAEEGENSPAPFLRLRQCWADAKKLEGAMQAISRHAGAIALFPEPWRGVFPGFVPDTDKREILQYDHREVEALGVVKVDILAIKTLDAIALMMQLSELETSPWDIPLDDKKVFEEIAAGNTLGIFQLSNEGMTDACRSIQPNNIHDLQNIIGIYRPATIKYIGNYARRKRGTEEPEPPHPLLEEALKETFGIMVWQEQAMQASVLLAGFTAPQADLLRKAIGKKSVKDLPVLEKLFFKGCQARHIPEQDIRNVWQQLHDHTGYSFNKAHSCCYSRIAYVTAWFRTHHREIFYSGIAQAALSASDFAEQIRSLSLDATRYGIRFQQPCMKNPVPHFQPSAEHPTQILSPLDSIPGIGSGLAAKMREYEIPKSWAEAQEVLQKCSATKQHIENLAHSGAFRNFEDLDKSDYPEGNKIQDTPWTRIDWPEPISPDTANLKRTGITKIDQFLDSGEETGQILGTITESYGTFGGKGYTLTVADGTGTYTARTSQALARKVAEDEILKMQLTPGQMINVHLETRSRNENNDYENKPEITSVGEIPDFANLPPLLNITLETNQKEFEQQLARAKSALQDHMPGTGMVKMVVLLKENEENTKTLELAIPWRVHIHPELVRKLSIPGFTVETIPEVEASRP